ncbi:MAG TPA: type II secretion system F family protein [Candidatus Krumholzibacteria bacterium]|nr:type II secretion system F family protein [Candidatus Krumholzibacteria bacterium]
MLIIVSALVALALLTGVGGIVLMRGNKRQLSHRLSEVRTTSDRRKIIPDEILQQRAPFLGRLIGVFGWLLPMQVTSETLRWELAQAGYRSLDAPGIYVGFRVLCTAAVGIASFMVTTSLGRPQSEILMLTFLGIVIGFMAPMMFLRWKQGQRRQEITLALPDALDLMVICVEAGLGLNAAILNVGKEVRLNSVALSEELRMVNSEMRAGISRLEALRNLAIRTGVDEVRALVAVLIQSDRFGTSIGQALRTHALSLRTRRRQRAEEAARKTPVKMVFPLVFCIFPELLVVILAPGMLQLFRALLDMAKG